MSVIVATAYMDEAQRFDWLVAMDGGRVLATGTPDELLARTGTDALEAAFIALLPEAKRRGHQPVAITPLRVDEQARIAIEARDLTMRFGDFTAVDHVNFRIRRGEIFGFLGSNGCGKSTTMKMLTGCCRPARARPRLFGKAVDPRDLDTRRRVGYMSQAFSLYGELTVRQNRCCTPACSMCRKRTSRRASTRWWRASTGGGARHAAGQPAAGGTPAPLAGGGDGAQARTADPRRADLGRRSGRARQLLAPADRAGARGSRHHLHLHPLHERGPALRPHLALMHAGRVLVSDTRMR